MNELAQWLTGRYSAALDDLAGQLDALAYTDQDRADALRGVAEVRALLDGVVNRFADTTYARQAERKALRRNEIRRPVTEQADRDAVDDHAAPEAALAHD